MAGKTKKVISPARRDGWTLAAWASVTLAVVGGAVFAIRNATDTPRLAIETVRTVPDPAQGLEQKRLAETVRSLSAERERLAQRVAALEESLRDVTASIPRPTDRPAGPRNAPPPAAPVPDVLPPSPDSQLIRSEFAIEVGSATDLDSIRSLWANLKGNHGKLLEGMRAVVGVRDGKPGAPPDLVLRVGPMANLASAAQLCARLGAASPACRPTIFDGQQLALR